jgi:hypothetical protein
MVGSQKKSTSVACAADACAAKNTLHVMVATSSNLTSFITFPFIPEMYLSGTPGRFIHSA